MLRLRWRSSRVVDEMTEELDQLRHDLQKCQRELRGAVSDYEKSYGALTVAKNEAREMREIVRRALLYLEDYDDEGSDEEGYQSQALEELIEEAKLMAGASDAGD